MPLATALLNDGDRRAAGGAGQLFFSDVNVVYMDM